VLFSQPFGPWVLAAQVCCRAPPPREQIGYVLLGKLLIGSVSVNPRGTLPIYGYVLALT